MESAQFCSHRLVVLQGQIPARAVFLLMRSSGSCAVPAQGSLMLRSGV